MTRASWSGRERGTAMASPFPEPSAIFSSAMTRFSEREAQPKGCGLGLAMKPLPRERRCLRPRRREEEAARRLVGTPALPVLAVSRHGGVRVRDHLAVLEHVAARR